MLPLYDFPEVGRRIAINALVLAALAALMLWAWSAAHCTTRWAVGGSAGLWERATVWATAQAGVTEATGHNDGEPIETWQRLVGIRRGDPYCAAGTYASFWFAARGERIPIARTPLANAIFAAAMRDGTETPCIPQRGDCMVWKHARGVAGHVAAHVLKVLRDGKVKTIEFNTSGSTAGSQRDGGGVYMKRRNWRLPLGRMYFRGFVGRK